MRFTDGGAGLFNVNWWQFGGASGGNLLTNGDMEGGATGWGVFGAGALTSNTSVMHGRTRSMLVTGRTASWNGVRQDVTARLINGRSYTTSVWCVRGAATRRRR